MSYRNNPASKAYTTHRNKPSLPARYMQSVTSEMVFTLCFFGFVVFVTAPGPEAIKQTQSTAKCAYPSSRFSCMIGAKIEKCAGNLEATKMESGVIQNDRRRISADGLCYLFLIFLRSRSGKLCFSVSRICLNPAGIIPRRKSIRSSGSGSCFPMLS